MCQLCELVEDQSPEFIIEILLDSLKTMANRLHKLQQPKKKRTLASKPIYQLSQEDISSLDGLNTCNILVLVFLRQRLQELGVLREKIELEDVPKNKEYPDTCPVKIIAAYRKRMERGHSVSCPCCGK